MKKGAGDVGRGNGLRDPGWRRQGPGRGSPARKRRPSPFFLIRGVKQGGLEYTERLKFPMDLQWFSARRIDGCSRSSQNMAGINGVEGARSFGKERLMIHARVDPAGFRFHPGFRTSGKIPRTRVFLMNGSERLVKMPGWQERCRHLMLWGSYPDSVSVRD